MRSIDFLRELKAIELIYEKSFFPELAYMFKHALTHDVAYHSMLIQRRKELHRVIALAIAPVRRRRWSAWVGPRSGPTSSIGRSTTPIRRWRWRPRWMRSPRWAPG